MAAGACAGARAAAGAAPAAVLAVAVAALVAPAALAKPQGRVVFFANYEDRNLCRSSTDCEQSRACLQGLCRDPCPGVCGSGAICRVVRHTPTCYCPEGTLGNPFVKCTPQNGGPICSVDSDCNPTSFCVNGRCENRCRTSPPVCGLNTVCTANPRSVDCSCLEGFIGNPFKACFPEEGFDGASRCGGDGDCRAWEACRGGRCEDPCAGACGANARCRAVDHAPDCSCAHGYVGDPLVGCSLREDVPSTTTRRPPGAAASSSSSPSPSPSASSSSEGAWLPALHRACVHCLCEAATGCERDIGCQGGYCGPFGVSRLYWHEAGRPVLPHDDPDRKEAYEDCANIYACASRIVTEYMLKLAKDCNGDGRVNCDDFAMAHHNGGYTCQQSLNRTVEGIKYQERYLKCRGEDEDDDPLGLAVAPSQ